MDKKAFLLDRLYVPTKHVLPQHKEEYTVSFDTVITETMTNEPKKCANCKYWMKPWKEKGKTQYCHKQGYAEEDICGDFEHRTVTRTETTTIESFQEKGNMTAFARGDLGKVEKVFDDFNIQDGRARPTLDFDLKFTSQLRDYQLGPCNDWLKYGYGIIKSPTASGKSVMISYIICQLGVKVIFLSHETRHLTSMEVALRQHTNITELEHQTGEKLIGYMEKGQGGFPITFATFQSFNSKYGKKALEDDTEKYGLVWVDECHHTGAGSYYNVFSSFNSFYKGGCSATPFRKDQMHLAIYNAMGPIVTEGKVEMLQCKVEWVNTGIKVPQYLFKYSKFGWGKMLTWLSKQNELTELVFSKVLEDLQNNRKVLIITDRLLQIDALHQMIRGAGYNVEVVIGGSKMSPDEMNNINERLEAGNLHCMIGNVVMNENVNFPYLDCLHLPLPSANEVTEEQRAGRIRRPAEGKPEPIIRPYCFEGAPAAFVGEKTRKKVYVRLGFIDGTPEPEKSVLTTSQRLNGR